jgi:hypothetical protein
MQRLYLLLFAALGLCAALVLAQSASRQSEQFVVYRALADSMFDMQDASHLVFSGVPMQSSKDAAGVAEDARRAGPDPSAVASLVSQFGETRCRVYPKGWALPSKARVGCEMPDENNPKQLTWVFFSPVGLSSDGTRAVLFAQTWCGGTCGVARYYLLAKERGVWRVVGVKPLWVS